MKTNIQHKQYNAFSSIIHKNRQHKQNAVSTIINNNTHA